MSDESQAHTESCGDYDQILEGIDHTGFPLEHAVVELLRQHGWTVISNRYYLDDIQPAVREIDMVAYKVASVRDFSVVTTLLVSCKKSIRNSWAMLSRDVDKADPNTDWQPVHVWSSCLESEFLLKETPWRQHYVWAVQRSAARGLLAIPDARIFAFQEMSHSTGKPQNDRAIFQSVTSLLKALGYELDALPSRIQDRRIHQFSLLSIIDAPDLLRIHFGKDGVTAAKKSDDVYLADYIVNRKRFAARVHFIHLRALDDALREYDSLHGMQQSFFASEYDYFYRNVLQHSKARRLLMDGFQTRTWYMILRTLPAEWRANCQKQLINAYYDEDDKEVKIETALDSEAVAVLNSDAELAGVIRQALKELFHYEGAHSFGETDVPF